MAETKSNKSPLLFLSHSGNDTEYAAQLRQAILNSPTAREAGLEVWFDKEDIQAGERWLHRIEEGLKKSTAFAVVIGDKGAINWVGREVDDAIDRATTDNTYRVIPVFVQTLTTQALEKLPRFLAQHQGITNPLESTEALEKLLAAVLEISENQPIQLLDFPFTGLRAMTERDSARFFGRDQEIHELIERFEHNRLLIIDADSGSGKSSLVRAGLVPKYRGGALEDKDATYNQEKTWHVVTMRPQKDAWAGLRKGMRIALQELGNTPNFDQLESQNYESVAYNLQCGLPIKKTEVLLVVDQFEEYFLQQRDYEQEDKDDFLDLLLYLTDDKCPVKVRVIATIRSDYFNLCRAYEPLRVYLESNQQKPVYRLRSIVDDPTNPEIGLEAIIRKPLKLVGYDNSADIDALVTAIRQDKRDRGSDLALIQMALEQCWNRQQSHGETLLQAYTYIGGISGVLANAANKAKKKLNSDEQESLFSVFARLIQVNDTGGITRRTASLDEFDEQTRTLAQKLADEDHYRLLIATENDIEVSHEAIFSQWGWLVGQIQQHSPELRVLNRLIERPEKDKIEFGHATGAELEQYEGLLQSNPHWISPTETTFVNNSLEMREHEFQLEERRKKNDKQRFTLVACTALISTSAVLLVGSSLLSINKANRQLEAAIEQSKLYLSEAFEAREQSEQNRSQALVALADVAVNNKDYVEAAKLILASKPERYSEFPFANNAIKIANAIKFGVANYYFDEEVRWNRDASMIITLSNNTVAQIKDAKTRVPLHSLEHEKEVVGAQWKKDSSHILTWSEDGFARIWDVETGDEIDRLDHGQSINQAQWNTDETLIFTSSSDNSVRVWDVKTGSLVRNFDHFRKHKIAEWNEDGTRIFTFTNDDSIHVWNIQTGESIYTTDYHDYIAEARLSNDGLSILMLSGDEIVRFLDIEAKTIKEIEQDTPVYGAQWNHDSSQFLTWISDDNRYSVDIWDAGTIKRVYSMEHEDDINGARWNFDGSLLLIWSDDDTASVWNTKTNEKLYQFLHEGSVLHARWINNDSLIQTHPSNGPIRIWDMRMPQHNTLNLLCWLLGDNTSLDDIAQKYKLTNLPEICIDSLD